MEFNKVTVIKKANIYFDGKVTSRTVVFANGEKKTLGIMLPGEYNFGTEAEETMEILAGEADVLLPGQDKWQKFSDGDIFVVTANSKFQLKVVSVLDYCCSYKA
ncbi:MAG: hypothetical protein H6Q74_2584 [Firmicutes bacterium]|nr:hypothetical protein [Bacillota bacterium]